MEAAAASPTLFSLSPLSSSIKRLQTLDNKPHILTPSPLLHHSSILLSSTCTSIPTSSLTRNKHSASGRRISFELYSSTVEETTVEETETDGTQKEADNRRKLYVVNLPWSLTVVDIKNLFGECGSVADVEIIKQKNGRSRGFAFITMSSGEEARAVIDKFDSHEVSGRIIRVEFAKRLRKPSPPPPPGVLPRETRHKLYVSNLAWKVRSTHLREFFANDFNPVSSRVVFDGPSGRSSGYGFVSFATREEAEAALTSLDGKELMGRSLRLKFSERKDDESGDEKQEDSGDQAEQE